MRPPHVDRSFRRDSSDYPGNVRELHNILEHALIICGEDMITPDHLPLPMRNRIASLDTDGPAAKRGMTEEERPAGEKERLLQSLDRHDWHRGRTAAALGIDRSTLWRKMKRLGLISAAGSPIQSRGRL